MHRRFGPAGLVALALTLAVTPAARAQYNSAYGYSFNNPTSAMLNTLMWQAMDRRMLQITFLRQRGYTDAQLDAMSNQEIEAAALNGQGTAAPAPPPASKKSPVASRFKPKGKRLLLPALVESLAEDPLQRKLLTTVFEAGFKEYEREAKKIGLGHDLAGAIAYFLGAACLAYRPSDPPDDAGLERLAHGLAETLDTPEMAQVPDADKQQFYELMVALGTYMLVTAQQAATDHDEALADTVKEMAGGALQGFLKLDPAKVRIGPTGLELIEG
jgi:hypothetical protein